MNTDVANDSGTGERSSKDLETAAWRALGALLLAVVALSLGYGLGSSGAVAIPVLMMAGGAALATGGLVGFLFGIPRPGSATPAPQPRPVATGTDGGNAAPASQRDGQLGYQPSTNLEQVADWLTKIIVGVSLVQLGKLRTELSELGKFIAGQIGGSSQGASAIAQSTVVSCVVVGFLASYLWTRVHYGRIQAAADAGILSSIETLTEELAKDKQRTNEALDLAKLAASGKLLSGVPTTPPVVADAAGTDATQALAEVDPERSAFRKMAAFASREPRWEDDPTHELFVGAAPTAKGRRLSVEIAQRVDETAFIFRASVTAEAGSPPLSGKVYFLLHPTVQGPIREVLVSPGRPVETQFYAEGTFHVAAIADGGDTTLLFDLSSIEGLPQGFLDA